MSNAITERPEDRPLAVRPAELGPSISRKDDPSFPRTVGAFGAALVIFGGMALGFHIFGSGARIGPTWAVLILACGTAGLLYHAAFDRDITFRRPYGALAMALLLVGAVLCVLPKYDAENEKYLFGAFLAYGVPSVLLGLMFFLTFQHTEADERLIRGSQLAVAGLGAALALGGLVGGLFHGPFLLPLGFIYSVMGLVLLASFIGAHGISDDLGYYASLGLAGLGGATALLVLLRSLMTEGGSTYFVSYGLILLLSASFYIAAGLVLALDWPVFVLLRRDLGSFFYSPVAYIALFAFSFFAWLSYLGLLEAVTEPGRPLFEPIVRRYFFALFPVFVLLFVVPVLTMRLLSEESRTGTLEVLFTAPVDEPAVVVAKFLCAMVTYLVCWLPFGLILLAIPLNGGSPFDYRPLLSFFVALMVSGAAFMSMGLFCSSLTQSQIGSGMLAFVGMLLLTFTYFASELPQAGEGLRAVLSHISYLHLWEESLQGKIVVRQLLFPISATVLFLFMTVKVLESRKWR
jgi:ABC-type transport system involved in multi-copper enzyme maturation permease subunit